MIKLNIENIIRHFCHTEAQMELIQLLWQEKILLINENQIYIFLFFFIFQFNM
jgi:hypothetical protein